MYFTIGQEVLDMRQLSVLIVDDDEMIRASLEWVLQSSSDFVVSGQAANGKEALACIHNQRPDLVLLDIQMPIMNGLECIRHIRAFDSQLPILILTTFNETKFIVDGLASGANGYLVKDAQHTTLTQVIRDTVNGTFIMPAEVASKLSLYLMQQQVFATEREMQVPEQVLSSLSKKEQNILTLLQSNLTNKEIAERLSLNERTLRNYLSTIYSKLNVNSRLEAVRVTDQQRTKRLAF
jgi:DNA-binding NarL/FixJ family response regulator